LKKKKKEETKVNRKELLTVLNKLKPGLSTKEITEEFSSFIFIKNHIMTNNNRVCILHPFKLKLSLLLPANELYNLLSSISSEEVGFKLKKDSILIKGSNTRAKLVLKEVTEDMQQRYNDIVKIKEDFKKLPENFIDGLKYSLFTISKDAAQESLSCVNIEKNKIMSTDDLRIGSFEMSKKIKDSFLLPYEAVKELIKFNVKEYCVLENEVIFKTESNVLFCSNTINDKFPDIKEYFEFNGEEIELPGDIADLVKRASILSDGDLDIDKSIDISIKDGKISCKGENNIGWIESESVIDFEGELEFTINPNFLLEILDKTNKIKVGGDRALFEIENFKYLTTLGNKEEE